MTAFLARWRIFIAERFPLASHVPMIAAFVAANALLGAQTLGHSVPAPMRVLIALAVAFSFFLRLRLFDEIKDYETDRLVNPTRPLARGLIAISEVKRVLGFLGTFELLALTAISPILAISHLAGLLYSLVMYREFFVGDFLRPHLTTYAVLHTFVSIFIGASVVTTVAETPFWEFSTDTWWCLLANWGYFNLFEFARKSFAPTEERANVDSYTKSFGLVGATLLSLSQALLPLLIFAYRIPEAGQPTGQLLLWAPAGLLLFFSAAFVFKKSESSAKRFRAAAGLFLVVSYLCVAVILNRGVAS